MIIEVVGKEIEKIKGDYESYLNGLNMVGEISYYQYSELYDEGTKQIQKAYELGKAEKNTELENKIADIKANCDLAIEGRDVKIMELESELEQAKKVKVVEHFEAFGQCRDSRRIAGLEQQIEKMKCCGNCDWSNYLPNGNCLDCDGKKNWKLKEIKEK